MATRIESLGERGRSPKAAWLMLFALVAVAVALAFGTIIGSDEATPRPVRPANTATAGALEPATQVPGLVKAGLQPRPYSGSALVEAAEGGERTIPDGFVMMPGGEVRPRFGG